MMKVRSAAAAFAYRAASLSSLHFPLRDPSILPITEPSSSASAPGTANDFFNVLNPAAINEDDPSAIVATVSSMGREDAREVSTLLFIHFSFRKLQNIRLLKIFILSNKISP